ncbi:hypothetical protein D9619_011605 [Psilocybe cf. subviscida]|uniref:Wax synthase domain-containing protein n=1 Tax=Psilocybe cf. subviscida TaxID=2480587 RepID=A0A8H5BSJ0_9AGAR|nr:hypothetical protein D9619_011605 [Psilocybe cf. subviscida]
MPDKAEIHPAVLPLGYALLITARAYGCGKDARFNWIFFVLIASLSIYHILFTTHDPKTGTTFGGTLCSLIFTASEHILLRNRQPETRQLGQTKPTSSMSFWERIKMSTSLIMSPRHIGFSTQVTSPHIRSTPPNVTRVQFITSGLKWMGFYYLLHDITCLLCHAFPMYGEGGLSFSECGWLWRTTIWLQIFGVSAVMSMVYTTASLVAVTLGINRPQAWPPYFGSLKDAYTVRNVWGRVWHQMLRKFVTAHGSAAADILGLPKSTFRTYFQIYVAFLVSGILHMAGDYMCLQNFAGVSLQFFLLQAVAITFEDVIMGVMRRLGVTTSSPLTRAVGFCWVFVWFVLSVPYWLEPVFHAGLFNATSPDKSPVQYLLTGQWKVSKGVFVRLCTAFLTHRYSLIELDLTPASAFHVALLIQSRSAMPEKVEVHPATLPLYALFVIGCAHNGGTGARFSSFFFVLIASLCIYQILFTKHFNPEIGTAVGTTLCSLIFTASEHILLRNRLPEIRQLGQTRPTLSMSFWERIKMSTNLIMSPRHIGFSTQVTSPHIRSTPSNVTRVQFITSELKWICFYYLLHDVAFLVCHTFPMYGEGGLSFSECGWLWRTTIWIHLFGIAAVMSMVYTTVSVVTVGLGINRPQAWPPQFGSLKDAYTVRNMWGRVWHQMLRKVRAKAETTVLKPTVLQSVTAHGSAAADILHLPKSRFRTYFQLYVAFLVSGLLHMAGDYMFLHNVAGVSVQFFLLQAVAITFEDAIIGVARRTGVTTSSPLTRAAGFCWVFVWFALTIPYWLEPLFHGGLFNATSPDVSLVQYLWNGRWKVSKGVFV